jgi:hypothetical protein
MTDEEKKSEAKKLTMMLLSHTFGLNNFQDEILDIIRGYIFKYQTCKNEPFFD